MMGKKKENKFQADLIKEIKNLLPGSMVLKNDSSYIQGIPDLTVLYGNRWATLECKKDEEAERQPNQPFYVDIMNNMSFSRFIGPENKKEVLDELQRSFKT